MIGASDASACRILMSMLYVKSRGARSNSFVLYYAVEEPIQLPIDGVLDLHTFRPRDVKDLVTEYLSACIERGIFQVRIIHGKGIGQLRQTVRTILTNHPQVVSFNDDHAQYGGWGATVVQLRQPPRS